MALKVDQCSPEVDDMASNWPILDALLGGTKTMRAAGKALLPKQPMESDEDYKYRLSVATLFPAYRRTVGVMAGKPMSKEVTLADDVPARIVALAQDIDGQGRNLHSFAADLMAEVMGYGYCGVLVDYTRTEGQARTQLDAEIMGARPYWVHVKHNQVLGWRATMINGAMKLVMLRLSETVEEEDGGYGISRIKQVRVLRPGSWETWRKVGDAQEYTLHESGTTTLDAIPFVPFYGIRAGYMVGLPPLMDLAYQNVKHWQNQSDQDDSARFARKRLLVFTGVDDAYKLEISSDQALKLPQGATADVVQGSAESVKIGREELDALEAQMIQTGAELLVARPGERTATEASNDAEANKSELQRIVETFEDSMDQCLQFTADWLKLPDGGHCSLFKDFAAGSLSEATAQLLLSLQQGGVITKATLIKEQQRRGILAADIDPDEELAAVAEEGPALGLIGEGTNGNGQ